MNAQEREMFCNWSMMVSIIERLRSIPSVMEGNQSLFDVTLEFGEQLNACGMEQLFRQVWRDIAFVRKQFATQLLQQFRHWSAVISVAWSQDDVEQFSGRH